MSEWGPRLGVFDLETTGVDVDRARIVSACVAVLDGAGAVLARWDWLADPGVEIPEASTAVHGITTDRARLEGRPAAVVVGEIAQALRTLWATGVPVVVYNAPFDLSLLDRESRRHGVAPIAEPSPVIDPLVLDKALDRYRPGKRTLEHAAEEYGVALDDAHDAGADAIAAGRVALALLARYPVELDLSPADLHGRQELWCAEQSRSFQDYLREVKGDPTIEIDSSWPIRWPEHPTALVDTQPIPRLPRPVPSPLALGAGDPMTGAPTIDAGPTDAPATPADGPAPSNADIPTALMELPPVHGEHSEPALFPAPIEEGPDGAEPDDPEPDDPEPDDAAPGDAGDEAPPDESPDADPAPDPGDPAPRPARPAVLRIVAAIVTDPAGRALLVRKAGTVAFMQPGGKIEPGESAFDALVRELDEELGLVVDPGATHHLGSFRAAAANEPDTVVRAEVFALETDAELEARGEIEELLWIDSPDTGDRVIAPLSSEHLLPLWQQRRTALF